MRKIHREPEQKGEFHSLFQQIKMHDKEYFFRCFRMSPSTFMHLLCLVGPAITKESTNMREPMSASERLAATLRYSATGDAQATIAASYRISPSSISKT